MLMSLRNLSIGLQIGLGFALVLSVLVVVGGFGIWNLSGANKTKALSSIRTKKPLQRLMSVPPGPKSRSLKHLGLPKRKRWT